MPAGFFQGIVHDRKLMREAQVNIAIRWFAGYRLDEKLPDHSSLTKIRQRDIEVLVLKGPEKQQNSVLIEVRDIGGIDHVDVSEFLYTLFSRKKSIENDVSVVLQHAARSFNLPDMNQECIDWFRIE